MSLTSLFNQPPQYILSFHFRIQVLFPREIKENVINLAVLKKVREKVLDLFLHQTAKGVDSVLGPALRYPADKPTNRRG